MLNLKSGVNYIRRLRKQWELPSTCCILMSAYKNMSNFMRYTTLSASQLKLLLKLPFPGVEITALWRVMIKQYTGHQRRSIIGKESLIRL